MNIKDSKELEFAIFCIENVASFLGRDAGEVYKLLTEENHLSLDAALALFISLTCMYL